jgi:hypothetical protein
MIKDSNDVNRASLDLANKVKIHIYMYVCILKKKEKRRKYIEVKPSIIILHEKKKSLRTHT